MNDVRRSYHANGNIRSELTLVDGVPHGVTRHWHDNGQLKSQIPLENGLVHGEWKEWNSKGELLGSSHLEQGTGKVYSWYPPDGPLMGISEFVDGVPHGLQVTYDIDGTELGRQYWLDGREVSKKEYEQSERRR
jgi:antitoxin component YwqK of YwqJK toxin-antitoxin module